MPQLEVQTQFLPKFLVQWRVLLLASKIYDYVLLPKNERLHLHFNFAGLVSSFAIVWEENMDHEEPCIKLDSLRVHYFFSNEEKSINNFLNSFEL